MREIKFRAWDKGKKEWLHSYKKMGGFSLFGETIVMGGWLSGISIERFNDIEVMQYTGLKDKNGVEVFVNDICKVHIFTQELGENMGVTEGEKEFIARIDFNDAGVQLINKDGDSGPIWAYGGFHEESLEVIGNVHENPELIGGGG